MTLIDRLRIFRAVQAYDFWLELRGTPWRRRRALRDELRANLGEAGQTVGAREALRAVGPIKALAFETVPAQPNRPRWYVGTVAAAATLILVLGALLYTSMVMLETAEAVGAVGQEIRTGIPPWWGVTFVAEIEADGSAFMGGFEGGWALLLPSLVVFLLVAQPWRLLRRGVPDTEFAQAGNGA